MACAGNRQLSAFNRGNLDRLLNRVVLVAVQDCNIESLLFVPLGRLVIKQFLKVGVHASKRKVLKVGPRLAAAFSRATDCLPADLELEDTIVGAFGVLT